MRYEFHPEALAEYEAAASYYAHRHPGLEVRFIEAVERAILQIRETPERWRILDGDVRRCLTRVFHTPCSTRLSLTTCLSSRSCTVIASRVTGVIGLNDSMIL